MSPIGPNSVLILWHSNLQSKEDLVAVSEGSRCGGPKRCHEDVGGGGHRGARELLGGRAVIRHVLLKTPRKSEGKTPGEKHFGGELKAQCVKKLMSKAVQWPLCSYCINYQ